jgi:hypothetical protein
MDDRAKILDVVYDFGHAADELDWPRLRGLFADQVALDYTSLNGGEPSKMLADELIAAWKSLLPGFDATQHVIASPVVVVDGDEAVVRTQVTGVHRIGSGSNPRLWEVSGRYRHVLRKSEGRWAIVGLMLTVAWQRGADLREEAQRRAMAGEGRA